MESNKVIEFSESNILNNKNENIKDLKNIPFQKVKIGENSNKCKNFIKIIWNFLKKYKMNIFLFLLNLTSIILYYLSLEPCGENATTCTLKKGLRFYIKLGVLCLISALCLSLLLTIIFFIKKGFFHLLCIPIFLFYFLYFNGTDVDEHGLYNSLVFMIFFCLSFPLFNYIFYIVYFFKKNKKKFKIMIILTIIIIIFLFSLSPSLSCEGWDIGLNNTKINNSKDYPCKIKKPNLCFIKAYDGVFDYSKYFKPSCSDNKVRENERDIFLVEMKNTKYVKDGNYYSFGYPITTQDRFIERQTFERLDFFNMINANMIVMELFNKINYPNEYEPELIVNFNKEGQGTLSQKINFNKTLSEERKKIANNNNITSLKNNILIIYIDTLSRAHFIRKLKKTSELIKRYMYYERNITKKKLSSFEFLKYQNFHCYTAWNVLPMFFGIEYLKNYNFKSTNYIKYLKERGYVTGQAGNICAREIIAEEEKNKEINFDYYDHESIALSCDPNYNDAGYSFKTGLNSMLKRCLYGKTINEYPFEYTNLFWESYKDNKKLFRIHFYDGHEGSMEVINYLDLPLYNFLNNFINKGYSDDTIIFIVSDHGNNMLNPFTIFSTPDQRIERFLGTLFLILPNDNILYDSGIYNNLIQNQQNLITPFDIYNSFIHIAYGDIHHIDNNGTFIYDNNNNIPYSHHGESLFNYMNKNERFCQSKKLNLTHIFVENSCMCIKHTQNLK